MILSLRDKDLARQDCDRLRSYDVPALEAPVHLARKRAFDSAQLTRADGFILTSQQAAYALPDEGKDRPVYCVGRASASAARERGYHHLICGPSDGAALASVIAGKTKTDNLCWLRAQKISFDMIEGLKSYGIEACQEIVYEMQQADSLPEAVCDALLQHQVTAIMALSQAQLKALVELLHHHELWHVRKEIDLYAVSEAVGRAAMPHGWQSITLARRKRALSVQAAIIHEWRYKRKKD